MESTSEEAGDGPWETHETDSTGLGECSSSLEASQSTLNEPNGERCARLPAGVNNGTCAHPTPTTSVSGEKR